MAGKKTAALLYLYGADNLLAQLKKGTLALQDDWSFLAPTYSYAQWHAQKPVPVTETELLAALKEEFDKLPASVAALLTWDDFLKQRAKLERNLIKKIQQQKRHTQVSGYSQDQLRNSAYLRLFASAINADAWERLASNYSGLCLALSMNATCLQPDKSPSLLRAVAYGEEYTPLATKDNPVPGAFHDYESRCANQEWRLLMPKAKGVKPLIRVRRGDVVRIFTSVHTSAAIKQSLRHLVQLDQRYKHTELFEVFPDVRRWRLSAAPMLDPKP